MRRLKLSSLVLALTITACRGGEEHHTADAQPEDDAAEVSHCAGRGEPLADVVLVARDASVDASLTLVSATPIRPIVGNNSWVFELRIDGELATGLAPGVTVTPFMPDHGHGTPTVVRIEEVNTGQYQFEPVHTRMAGYWEVTVLVEAQAFDLTFVIKVCVD